MCDTRRKKKYLKRFLKNSSNIFKRFFHCHVLRFKIKHSPRPKEKNNTLGYPIMKKEKPKELGSKDP